MKKFSIFALYIIISGLLSNVLGRFIPRSSLNADAFPYKTYNWEHNGDFYNRFHVTKWKKKVPDMSKVLKSLYPKTVSYPPTSVQVERLIKETCVAEFIHTLLIAVSPLIYRIIGGTWGKFYTFCSIIGNLPYIIIQRYNRPKMKRLYLALCNKESKSQLSEALLDENINIIV